MILGEVRTVVISNEEDDNNNNNNNNVNSEYEYEAVFLSRDHKMHIMGSSERERVLGAGGK